MKLVVRRFHDGMASPRYDGFELEPRPGMTVLEALFWCQETFDDSLAFHYSCRGAVCGTCAMLINKVPRLACRSQLLPLLKGQLEVSIAPYPAIGETVPWNPQEAVLVEPLPHLPVIRDLIVDMRPFFSFYRYVEPVFRPQNANPEEERLMDPAAVRTLELYTNCILCAACHGACPVSGQNPQYLGPAALAKLYRFHIDPREDGRGVAILRRADVQDGWWGCEMYGNCTIVCPKGVPPRTAIAKAVSALRHTQEKSDRRQNNANE
ncbi:MAG TPA: succinate dehydrogenase/fumarate reductase iron-sulfur subunit [Candidatus Bathyarchaeia archaeon]|nr:succinate dehydrogenase/fumarate reductase iron-sulfur subunit [Candidatus Bathyarchaeia archaeon]